MTVKDVFHSVCNLKGISLSQAAENIGIRQGTLWNQLDSEDGMNIKIGTLVRYLAELDCEIYVSIFDDDVELLVDGDDEEIALDGAKNREGW